MVDHITIRKYVPQDSAQVTSLLQTREELDYEGASKRTELMNWIAFNNPFTENDEPSYFVAEDQGKIVAFHGRMPSYFNFNGEKVKGYYVHDLYVDPEYRKKGLGFWLTIAIAKAIEEQSDHFFNLFGMTPLNLTMQRRRKYFETVAPRYVKLINPKKQLREKLKSGLLTSIASPLLAIALSIADGIKALGLGGIKVSDIDKCGDQYDEFYSRVASKMKIATYKTSALINWKFLDRPYPREKMAVAKRGDQIVGYIIYSVSPYDPANPKGMIVDLIVDPNEQKVIKALCNHAVKYFRKQKVATIESVMSDPLMAEALKSLFFFKKKKGKTVMLGNLSHYNGDSDHIKEISNWQMMECESDAFMLSL